MHQPQMSTASQITPLDPQDIQHAGYSSVNAVQSLDINTINKTPTNTPAVNGGTSTSPLSMTTKRASPALVISPKLLTQIRAEGARRSETFTPQNNHQLQSIIR